MTDSRLILATGGLLWRDVEGHPRVAVIHRPKYNDWCLPKGKLEQDEAIEQAALREIREETGCHAQITGLVGTTAYTYDGILKVVVYWKMKAQECRFHPSQEVDQLEWVPPDQAKDRLSHIEEQEIVAKGFKVAKPGY